MSEGDTLRSSNEIIISTNQFKNIDDIYSINNTALPDNIKVEYTIYSNEEDTFTNENSKILQKDAVRLLNGDYHLDLPGYIKRKYIYKIKVYSSENESIVATYYFRYE
ncbi:hypothetical protein D3C76_1415020 [compost metagenome]